jgi:hypothetical protein
MIGFDARFRCWGVWDQDLEDALGDPHHSPIPARVTVRVQSSQSKPIPIAWVDAEFTTVRTASITALIIDWAARSVSSAIASIRV